MAVSYDVANREGADATPQQTSTGTADVKTFTRPPGASAFIISVETTNARVSFDGVAPSATNGHVFPAAAAPQFVPFRGKEIQVASAVAGSSIVNITWLEPN